MDTEEGFVKLIYSKDELKNLPFSIDEVDHYLQQLGSCGLEKLNKELLRIAEERASIISQTQELAFQNYPTFIETAKCTQEISSDFKCITLGTTKLTVQLQMLKEKCLGFSETAQSLSSARRLTSLALSRHTQLLEILELPQLMDTCVRNGYWEEALELSAHVVRMERKLGYIPLITNIAKEVQSCTRLMLSHLVAQLRMPAALPHCLKVVGYLRRMGVFSEEELRLKFLQARDAWFRSTLEEIPKDDAYQHVLKTIELSRGHLYDIAIQYRAIFTDEDPLVLANQDSNINDSAIFLSWIIEKVTEFLATLRADLTKVPLSSLESVMSQCMYFGLSFGRIGCDFRALLVPLFSQVTSDRFDQAALKAESDFAGAMASFSLMRIGSCTGAVSSSAADMLVAPTAGQIQAPHSLLKFPPLASLCNGLIAAFNEFRLCAVVQLASAVVDRLHRTLRACAQVVADFHRHEKEAMTPREEDQFDHYVDLFCNDLLDYVQKILQLLFPPTSLTLQTGFPLSDVHKQALLSLDRQGIIQPISYLLKIAADPPPPPVVEESSTAPEIVLQQEEPTQNENPAELPESAQTILETVTSQPEDSADLPLEPQESLDLASREVNLANGDAAGLPLEPHETTQEDPLANKQKSIVTSDLVADPEGTNPPLQELDEPLIDSVLPSNEVPESDNIPTELKRVPIETVFHVEDTVSVVEEVTSQVLSNDLPTD